MFSSGQPGSNPPILERGTRLERQQQYRDATRRAILDAALELFVVDGYASVSIRSIAAKVDYSPAAIYGYFPSKDEIFFALAEEGLSSLARWELEAEATADPLNDVRAMLWRLYAFSQEQPKYFALVFLDRHVPRPSKASNRFAFMSEVHARAVARMQRCIEAGAMPAATSIDVAVRLLFAPVIGLAALGLTNRLAPWENLDSLVRQAIDVTLAGFERCPPSGVGPGPASQNSCTHSDQ